MADELLDLHSAFASRTLGAGTTELYTIGHLAHDGAIVACDPFIGSAPPCAKPFARVFAPGLHPVELLVLRTRNDERVALARVVFSSSTPVLFELATPTGEDVHSLLPGLVLGYAVDAGLGCFTTPRALETYDDEALLAELERHERTTWSWATTLPQRGGHGLVAFSSGAGDGVYATYVGLSADGVPACLVTDFEMLPVALP